MDGGRITNADDPGSLGSQSHSDRPNWQPATNSDEYLRNCREGLEDFSERRLAQLTGWSRVRIYRQRLMAELPEELFEQLLAAGVKSSKAMAAIALALNPGRA